MGCLFSYFSRHGSKRDPVEPVIRQPFSWEREEQNTIKKEDFILDKLQDQTIYRLPGSINGQQFIIQNCQNCTVYVFDYTGQVQIDDCINCRILIGPIHGSIFIRDSTNCVLACVCQQFRTRDCRDLYVYLACTSQPIIESSHNIRFGCLTLTYDRLKEHYQSAGISPWNNNWSNVHDFTSVPDGKNYSLLDQNENIFKRVPIPVDPSCQHLNVKDDSETSVTPFTYGNLYRHRDEEHGLIIFFHDSNADATARALIHQLKTMNIVLIQTKSYVLDGTNAERMFGNLRNYHSLISKGPILGLEFAGNNCQQILQNAMASANTKVPFFVSQSTAEARVQLEKFYNFASMQMFT